MEGEGGIQVEGEEGGGGGGGRGPGAGADERRTHGGTLYTISYLRVHHSGAAPPAALLLSLSVSRQHNTL